MIFIKTEEKSAINLSYVTAFNSVRFSDNVFKIIAYMKVSSEDEIETYVIVSLPTKKQANLFLDRLLTYVRDEEIYKCGVIDPEDIRKSLEREGLLKDTETAFKDF